MNIAIVGSRSYPRLDQVQTFVEMLAREDPTCTVVSGGARGVDSTAEDTADHAGLLILVLPAQWAVYGKSAGFRRNTDIVAHADAVVAFWDGVSRGTLHTVRLARQKGLPLLVFGPTSEAAVVVERTPDSILYNLSTLEKQSCRPEPSCAILVPDVPLIVEEGLEVYDKDAIAAWMTAQGFTDWAQWLEGQACVFLSGTPCVFRYDAERYLRQRQCRCRYGGG